MMDESSKEYYLGDSKNAGSSTLFSETSIQFSKNVYTFIALVNTEKGPVNYNNTHQLSFYPIYFLFLQPICNLYGLHNVFPFSATRIEDHHSSGNYNNEGEIIYCGKEEIKTPTGKKLCHKFTVNDLSWPPSKNILYA